MAKKILKLEDPTLRSILQGQINNAIGYLGGLLSDQREKSLEYYQGDPLGNEMAGRSQVVSTDVADTVESLLPNLLRIFTSSDKVVRCEPVRAEDEPLADQATAYLNHIFYKENDGFTLLYNFFKDALIEKNGILKIFYDETAEVEHETYKNLTDEEYKVLTDNPEIEILEEEVRDDEKAAEQIEIMKAQAAGQTMSVEALEIDIPIPQLHDCKIKRTSSKGKIKVESIPPEEFLIDKSAVKLEDAEYVGHRVQLTRTQLVEMGYDKEEVYNLPTADATILNTEKLARFRNIEDYPYDTSNDPSTQKIQIYENYIRYDYDGDGIAELRKVVSVGSSAYTILENMPCDQIPFVSVTPIPMPHRFYGVLLLN